MKKSFNILFILAAISFLCYGHFKYNNKKTMYRLPIFGNPGHKVGKFTFTDQNGKIITEKEFEDKIYIVDFFFTTCQSICPVMSNEMERVVEKYKDNTDVKFLSHTVDPETDSIEVLAEYANKHKAPGDKWYFVTGDKKNLYDAARNFYLLDTHQGDGGADDFIHTQNFALIDKNKQIRGFYDGTNPAEIDKLIREIDILLNE
jgi:protein SCO1/2